MNELRMGQKDKLTDLKRTSGGAATSAPIPDLVAALELRQVRYCHWKSNVRLPDSLRGKEDLDLLVRRSDAAMFFAALSDAGFKLARSRDGGGHPGVIHAFALDPNTIKLVHVHAYFQVVTGDSLVKSFHLPFEDMLLENTQVRMTLPVPSPEAELVVFLLRIALKHTGALEYWMVNRHYRAVPKELSWLRNQADEDVAQALWMQYVPGAKQGEFDRLMRIIADPEKSRARVLAGLGLAWRLRDWRRLGFWAGAASRLRRFAMLVTSRLLRRKSVQLVSGGVLIALVGPKASGKSTLGAALGDRLGKQLDLRRIHVGKPPATLISAPFRVFLPILRQLLPAERSGQYHKPERRADLKFSMAYVVRMVLLAYDRRVLLFRIRRAATSGAIVITDRYPPSGTGSIDGQQFGDAAIAVCDKPLKKALMRLEARLCNDLPKPDLVIRLTAPIQTTLLRDASRDKRDGPDPDSVLTRRDIEAKAVFPDTPVLTINTDVPLDQSVEAIVRAVWDRL